MVPPAPSLIRLGTASPTTQATTPDTIALVGRLARRAADQSIDILLLPEAFIGGYPRGSTFGSAVGGRSKQGRDDFAAYFAGAVDFGDTVGEAGAGAGTRWVRRELGPDPGADALATAESDGENRGRRGDGTREELEKIAAETGVFVVVGCIEKAGGSLYCAVVYVCPRQGIIGKRRKVMPTAMERLIWAQGAPSTLRAVTTVIRGVRINLAAAICWENYMPLVRQSLYAQNVNLYLAPTADARDTWMSLMRTVGFEGRCFVVSSNMASRGPADGEGAGSAGAAVEKAADGAAAQRRNSVAIEGGHEVAMPKQSSSRQDVSPARRRRKSVFDQDGNEIVLSCDADDTGANGTKADAGAATKPKAAAAEGSWSSPWASRGGSSVVSPYGEVLAGPQWEDDDELIYADVDFKECIRGRLDLDTAGSYSRNDSFKLSVAGLDLEPLPY